MTITRSQCGSLCPRKPNWGVHWPTCLLTKRIPDAVWFRSSHSYTHVTHIFYETAITLKCLFIMPLKKHFVKFYFQSLVFLWMCVSDGRRDGEMLQNRHLNTPRGDSFDNGLVRRSNSNKYDFEFRTLSCFSISTLVPKRTKLSHRYHTTHVCVSSRNHVGKIFNFNILTIVSMNIVMRSAYMVLLFVQHQLCNKHE